MSNILSDFRHGLRGVVRRPLFSVVVIVTIALGIGGNAAIFGLLNGIFLRPFPFGDADRLLKLSGFDRERGFDNMSLSYPDFVDLREESETLEHLVAFDPVSFNLSAGDRPERVAGARVSVGLFQAFDVEPLRGRTFQASDDRPGAAPVTILNEGLWRRRFGGADIVGEEVELDGRPHTVIGIVPAAFQFPIQEEIWTPLALDPFQLERRNRFLGAVALPRPGVGLEQVQSEMSALASRLAEEHPLSNQGIGIEVEQFRDFYVGRARGLFFLLQAAVLFVLLIACTNVANLLLARGAAREGEMAVRTAIGAGRGRLIRQLLAESVVLALIGGMVGLALGYWGVSVLVRSIPVDLPFWIQVDLDGRVLAFVALIAVGSGLAFGLVPAIRNSRTELVTALKEGGAKAGGRRRQRLFKTTVVAEMTLTIVLLICAGLMIESFFRLQDVDPGLNPEGVLTAQVPELPELEYGEDREVISFYARLVDELAAAPGVESVAANSRLPLRSRSGSERIFNVEDKPELAEGERLPFANFQVVTPGYFETLQIPILDGRTFDESDSADSPGVVVINRKMAERLWPDERAVGKRIRLGAPEDDLPWLTVVGVAGDVRHRGLDQELMLDMYMAHRQMPMRSMTMVLRSALEPTALSTTVRETVSEVDADIPAYNVMSMAEVVEESMWLSRFSAYLLVILGGVALLLAAVGLYGVVAYFVAQRVSEIGLRMSLGASRRDVLSLVLRQSMGLILVGLLIGLPLAVLLNRSLAGMLYGVGTLEVVPLIGVAAVLGVVALVASFIPARRAAWVQPAVSLRAG